MSKNAVGIILLLASLWGLDVPEKMIEDAVAGVSTVVSLALLIWHQLGRPDITMGLWKTDRLDEEV